MQGPPTPKETPAAPIGEPASAAVRLKRAAADLEAAVDALKDVPNAELPSTDHAAAILTDAVRLFARYRAEHREPEPHSLALTPTEAVIAAAALLRSQDLSPFEFAIWFDADTDANAIEGS